MIKISRLDFGDWLSFIPGSPCVACCKKLSSSGVKSLKLSFDFQGRVQVYLSSFSKTSEKQKF